MFIYIGQETKIRAAMPTLVTRYCQKIITSNPCKGLRMQRTHKKILNPRNMRKFCQLPINYISKTMQKNCCHGNNHYQKLPKSIITTLVGPTKSKVKNKRKSVAMLTGVAKCCLKLNHKFLL